MIGHHLHLAARSIPRAGPFVFISIVGLAIGLGAALLIGLSSGGLAERDASAEGVVDCVLRATTRPTTLVIGRAEA